MHEPILITGAARSGTSLIAGIINICGAWGGTLAPPNSNNKKGMFENIDIRQHLVKPYLRSLGVDPMGQNPLPNLDDAKLISKLIEDGAKWRSDVLDVVNSQGYKEGAWFYKGAKMCLLWPLWHNAFPDANWVIVRRSAKAIAKCCINTSFMRAFRTEIEWVGWVLHHEHCFEDMAEGELKIQHVWPDKVVNGNLLEIKRIINRLGLIWNEDKVREFIAPELWEG